MYLEKAITGNNKWWTYLVTILIVIFFSQVIGSAPLGIVIGVLSVVNQGEMPSEDLLTNPEAFGIDPNLFLALIVIPFAMGLLGLFIGIRSVHKKKFKDVLTGYSSFNWNKVLYGAAIWGAISVIYLFASIYIDGQNYTLQFDTIKFIILIIIAFLFIPLQSSFEEVLFRGYLMQGFALIFKNKWLPLMITSILFGSLHALNPEVKEFGLAIMLPQYIFFGLLFGIVVIFDNGLELVIGVHAINNIFSALFMSHESSVLQTPALFKISEVYPLVDFGILILMSVIFLYLAGKKYNWPGFKTLFEKINFDKEKIAA